MTRLLIPLVAEPAPPPVPMARAADDGLQVLAPLAAWTRAVTTAADECLVIDPRGQVAACSSSAGRLLDVSESGVLGRPLTDAVQFVGFGTRPSANADTTHRLAPVVALRTGSTSRGLARVRHHAGRLVTVDVVAVPLHDSHRTMLGVLVHLAEVAGR